MIDESRMEVFRLQAEICKTMADVKRLMIIHELRDGEKSVGQLVSEMGVPQSNVSQHLALLRERDIVSTRREGTSIFYSLANPKIGQACDMVQEVLADQLARNQVLADSLGERR